jgi:cellulose synthase operon protein C
MVKYMSFLLRFGPSIALLVALTGCGRTTPEEHITAAQHYLDVNQPASAVLELKSALKEAPENVLARVLAGKTYILLGDGATAEKELERAVELGGDPSDINPLIAKALLLQENFPAVLEIDADQEGLSPKARAAIHGIRGVALLASDGLDAADREFGQGIALDAASTDVLNGAARLAAMRDNPGLAREYLDKVFAIDPDNSDAWVLSGDLERADGKLEDARAAYTKALQRQPSNTLASLNRIAVNIALANTEAAKNEVNALKGRGIVSGRLDYLDGVLNYQEGLFDPAQNLFEKAMTADPRDTRSLYFAATSALQNGREEIATLYLKRFVTRSPGFAPALKILAWLELKHGNFAQAESYIRSALVAEPEDVYSLNLLASALQGDSRSAEKSVEVLKQVVALDPKSATAKSNLGMSMVRAGMLEQGLRELESAREMDPGALRNSATIVFTYLNSNQLDKALEAAQQMRDDNPDNAVAMAILGTVFLARKEYDKATTAFNDTLGRDKDNITAMSGLASLAAVNGKPEEAKKIYREILQRRPGDLTSSMNLAYLAASDGSVEELQKVLSSTIDANPAALLPRLTLSRYYMMQRNYAGIVEILTPVQDTGKANTEFLRLLCQAQFHTGDFTRARDNLQVLAQSEPDDVDVQYMLALTLRKLGDAAGAKKGIDHVLKLTPKHFGARLQLVELLLAAGDTAAARENLALLQERSPDTKDVLKLEGALESAVGNHKAAVAAYQRAFEIEGTNYNLLNLETATWDSGDQNGAVTLLTSWLAKVPNDNLTSLRLATRYAAMGRQSDAVDIFNGLLKQAPNNVVVLNNLAWLLQDTNNKQALDYAERAFAAAPDSLEVKSTLAVVVSETDIARAQQLMREVLRAKPKDPNFRYQQALIYKRAHQNEQAIQSLNDVLRDSPDFPNAGEAKKLLSELGG